MKNLIYLYVLLSLGCAELYAQNIQRVRLNLETPLGYTRQLMLGFTPDNAATDDFDYGYDAINPDDFPDDFSWMIEDQECIIQGVGEFQTHKKYPIGFFLSNSGNITISLHSTENFSNPIEVYIYDALEDIYTKINDQNLTKYKTADNYTDRYFIAFDNLNGSENLSINDPLAIAENVTIKYDEFNNNLKFRFNSAVFVNAIEVYNQLGQIVLTQQYGDIYESLTLSMAHKLKEVLLVRIHTDLGTITKSILL